MFLPLLKGNIHIDQRGVAFCKGECEIGTTEISNTDSLTTAFSFEFCSLNLEKHPKILFGVKQSESIVLLLDYFGILRTVRSITVSPHIPSDGLGVSIHLLVSENEISLYINEVLQTQKYTLDTGAFSFFLSFNSISTVVLTPFSTIDLPKVFFPDLTSHLWAQLPFRVSLRGFNIKSASDSSRNIFSEEELRYLPGLSKTRYFEVIYRSITTSNDNSSAGIGLVEQPRASTDMPPGYGFHSIGLFIEDKSLYVNSSNEFTILGKDKIKSGSVIGIGIHPSGGIFVTFNGKRANQSLISIPSFQKYFPVITTNGICDEVTVNLGQLPFSYREISPPFGWCLYCSPSSNSLFQNGPPNESHLLHFFPFTCHTQRHADCFLASFQLPDPGRFEVTILKMKGDDIVAIGFSDQEFNVGDMVGWCQKSIGIHSDDGNCFFEDVNNPTKVCDQRLVTEGKTIGLSISQKKITYTIDSSQYYVISDFSNPTYPTITIEGPIALIINFGESPFAGEPHENSTEGTKLFNGRRVRMTNNNLSNYGLAVGDEVECRDLSFRGHFVGELNGRLYFNVNGIDGAVPLDTNDPVLVSKLIRVTRRKSDTPFLQPLLTFNSVVLNNVAFREKHKLYASPYGLAVLCGHYGMISMHEDLKSHPNSISRQDSTFIESQNTNTNISTNKNSDSNLKSTSNASTSTNPQKNADFNSNSQINANSNLDKCDNSFSLHRFDQTPTSNEKPNPFNILWSNKNQIGAPSHIRNSNSVVPEKQNPFNNMNSSINRIRNSNSMQTEINNPFNNLKSTAISTTPISPSTSTNNSNSKTTEFNYNAQQMQIQTPPNSFLVLRPIFDFMNNSPCFTSLNGAINILELNKIVPSFKTYGIKFLDVVSDSDRNVLLMLGSQNNIDVGWNNVNIVQLKGKPKIVFRFYGFALKKIQSHSPVLVNVGNRQGGELFLPNYHGTNGSSFFQHSTTQKSFGSKGFALLPPIVQQLICSLNDHYFSKLKEKKKNPEEKIDISEIIYSTQTHIINFYKSNESINNDDGDDDETDTNDAHFCDLNVNLITETDYTKLK